MTTTTPVSRPHVDVGPRRIVLFDGVCGMCNGIVDLLMRIDKRGVFRYAPLQGTTAAELRAAHPEIPADLASMVLVDDDVVYLRMKGVSRGTRYLPFPWKLGYVVFFLPGWLTNPIYDLIASLRYRLFGKKEVCRIPSPHERERFLP
jgi:predicted DCC family thiol-disulfide oxidoreductase YuxK